MPSPYRPPEIEPVCCCKYPNAAGAKKPPRFPIELINAIMPAATRASRYPCGMGQKRDAAALKPMAEKQIATNDKTGLPDVEANKPHAAITSAAASHACWKRHFADSSAKQYIAT